MKQSRLILNLRSNPHGWFQLYSINPYQVHIQYELAIMIKVKRLSSTPTSEVVARWLVSSTNLVNSMQVFFKFLFFTSNIFETSRVKKLLARIEYSNV